MTPTPSDAQPVAWRWRGRSPAPWHIVVSEHEALGAGEYEPLYPESALLAERQAREAAERERDEAHGGWATDREKFLDIESDLTQRAEAAEVSLAKAQARIAELEAALRPFASYFEQAAFDLDNLGNPLPDDQGMGWVYLTIGDFRRARSVLSSINKDAGHRALANTDGEPGR